MSRSPESRTKGSARYPHVVRFYNPGTSQLRNPHPVIRPRSSLRLDPPNDMPAPRNYRTASTPLTNRITGKPRLVRESAHLGAGRLAHRSGPA